MTDILIPKCKHCGEDTTHNTESSFFGYIHRYGPTDHVFEVEDKQEIFTLEHLQD